MARISMYLQYVVLLSVFLIVGCSASEKPIEPAPVELGTTTSVDTPERELLRDAQKFYNSRLYTNARETFEKIRDGYPFGPYAEYAEIKIADSYFYNFDYATAARLYSDFAKQRPASTNLAYALVQAGRSNQLQYGGLGRDTEPLERSIELYRDLLKRIPNSLYTEATRRYLKDAQNQLIKHEKMVAQFYNRLGKEQAAKARAEKIKERQTAFKSEIESLANSTNITTAAVEVPKLYQGPYSPVSRAGGSTKNNQTHSSGEQLASSRYTITKVDCNPDEQQLFIHLNRDLETLDLEKIKGSLAIKEQIVQLKMPQTRTQELSLNCLGTQDLKISQSGEIQIATTATPDLLHLKNPGRLLIVLH